MFEDERPKLIAYRGRFDGFHSTPASVSKMCLVRFDNNRCWRRRECALKRRAFGSVGYLTPSYGYRA